MSTNETTPVSSAPGQSHSTALLRSQKRKKKAEGRKKRTLRLKTDKEFAKAYFESRSKRATEKKSAFKKKKSRKK